MSNKPRRVRSYDLMVFRGGGFGPVSDYHVVGIYTSPSKLLTARNALILAGEKVQIYVDLLTDAEPHRYHA